MESILILTHTDERSALTRASLEAVTAGRELASRLGASLAIGILGAASEYGTGSALTANGADLLQQGFGSGLAISAQRVLDRFLNILPTVTIREGARVKIYLSNDLLLPDYSQHQMPSDL